MQEVWLRRRANDHEDALRLILEPRFQINAVPAGRGRGEGRRCENHARHHPGDVLGGIGDGHDGHRRQTRRRSRYYAVAASGRFL